MRSLRLVLLATSIWFVVAVILTGCGPKVGPASALKVTSTPPLLERGAYLAHAAAACVDCHSTRDWSRYSGPAVVGTEGKGGEGYLRSTGFPGDLYVPNITPTALSSWSDGELERALVAGVDKDGGALFPVMPYPAYASLCQDDVNAVIAYLRTLSPIAHEVPPRDLNFPLGMVVNTMPKELPRPPCPPTDDAPASLVARGAYLGIVAGCQECHTQSKRGEPLPGLLLAGGRAFQVAGGTVASSNLTPDHDTGLGAWTAETFVARFRVHTRETAHEVGAGDPQTVMSWTAYAGLSDDDLRAIFAWLQTASPVKNPVVKWTPMK